MILHAAHRLADEIKRDIPGARILMIANGVGILRDRGVTDIPAWAVNCPSACWLVRVSIPGKNPSWCWYESYLDDLLVEIIAKHDPKLEPQSSYLDETVPSYRYYKGGDTP